MTNMNEAFYLQRRSNSKKSTNGKSSMRNWWLVKENVWGYGVVSIGKSISFPKGMVGKRVRFKVEMKE